MFQALLRHNQTVFSPNRGKEDPAACTMALKQYDGHWGPWVDVPS